MAADRVILGNDSNCIFSTDPNVTGINNNILVVGGSGDCGIIVTGRTNPVKSRVCKA